jgi:hypothetical protein
MRMISVCIPVHDPLELHKGFLVEALESIRMQTLHPKEVIMGGSYRPTYLAELLNSFNEYFPVKFIENKSTSASSNVNSLVSYCSGSIIKILFQDDFFISNTALADTNLVFKETNPIWVACASRNYDQKNGRYVRNVNPKFHKKIAEGVNSIGSPSVISFRKDYFLPFNENLVWMLDCEWYLQMQHRFGNPFFITDFQIANRLHGFQATHNAKMYQKSEVIRVNNLHLKSKTSNSFFSNKYRCVCLRNYNE